MLDFGRHKIQIFLNDYTEEFSIMPAMFESFILYENLNYNIYTAELRLKHSLFMDILFTTGEKVKIILKIGQMQTATEVNMQEFTLNMMVFEYKIYDAQNVIVTLVPQIFDKLYRKKITKVYQDKPSGIVQQICTDVGITDSDIENTPVENRTFMINNKSYFYTLKYVSNWARDYFLWVDRTDKMNFSSIARIKNNNQVAYEIPHISAGKIKVENNSLLMQYMGGLGATGYYFNWNTGSMTNYTMTPTDYFSPTDSKDATNSIQMLDPIGDIYYNEQYNKNYLDNTVLQKNQFKLFISFMMLGAMQITMGSKVSITLLNTLDQSEDNKYLSGEWIVYSVAHHFTATEYMSKVVCGRDYLSFEPNKNPAYVSKT